MASALLRLKSVEVAPHLQLQLLQCLRSRINDCYWTRESPSGAPGRRVCARQRRMVSEFIEKGFDLLKSRQTEEKTPQDKRRTSVTDVVHVIILWFASVTTGARHRGFDIVYVPLTSACKINSLSTEITWTLERSKWGCCAAVATTAVKPRKMKARELTPLTSPPSGDCTSVFKHPWQDFRRGSFCTGICPSGNLVTVRLQNPSPSFCLPLSCQWLQQRACFQRHLNLMLYK